MNTRYISAILLLTALSLPIGMSACGGSKESTVGNSYLKRIGLTPYDLDTGIAGLNPEIVVQPNDDGTLYLGVLIGVGERERSMRLGTITELKSFSFIVFDTDGKWIDSLYTDDITRSGLGGRATSIMASAGTTWKPDAAAPHRFRLVTLINTESGTWLKEVVATLPEMIASDPIVLTLDPEEKSGGIEFILKARRVKEPPVTEQLPTSETHRIEIYEGPISIWSSSDGKSFTQAIGKVEPDDVGETATYKVFWNGNTRSGTPARRGTYTIVGTIPAKPTPYTIRKEFEWGGR